MGTRRTYGDRCGIARALDVVGERWALLVVRELLLGPKRFGDIGAGLPGLSANVLTQRLEGLERAGILTRRRLPPPANAPVYALTPWGLESEPILRALGRWAARSPRHDPRLPLSAAGLFLTLRTLLDPERAAGLDIRVCLRLGAETFLAHLAGGVIDIAAAPVDGADIVFTGPPHAMAAALHGGQKLGVLEDAGALEIDGDWSLAERFVTLFPLPPSAPCPD